MRICIDKNGKYNEENNNKKISFISKVLILDQSIVIKIPNLYNFTLSFVFAHSLLPNLFSFGAASPPPIYFNY
mgnify:CR=1 FL=1